VPAIEDAKELIRKHRLERVLVVDDDFKLRGLITVKDILKSTEHPLANKDASGRLRAGAAVGVGAGTEERVELLAEAGVDVIVVDTAHGHSQGVLDRVKWVKKNFPQSKSSAAISPRPTRHVRWLIGRRWRQGRHWPRFDLYHPYRGRCRRAADHRHPECFRSAQGDRRADDCRRRHPLLRRYRQGDCGRCRYGHAGWLFAGTEEAPGEVELFQGRSYKSYRGMGSLGAMQAGSSDRYFQENNRQRRQVRAGRHRRPGSLTRGSVLAVIHQLMGGVRSSMGYLGCATI
jgi:IMP dehydrogenase